jgi:hypothetical protein
MVPTGPQRSMTENDRVVDYIVVPIQSLSGLNGEWATESLQDQIWNEYATDMQEE